MNVALRLAALLGAHVVAAAQLAGAALRLASAGLRERRQLEAREAVAQTYVLANGSAPFVVVVMSFIGAIMVIQACVQAQRIVGDLSSIGAAFLPLVVREFGPTIVALMAAARFGAGIAAELGAMTTTEQIDALRLSGAEPAGTLVLPRLVAGLVGMLPLVVLGSACAFVAGGVAAHRGFGVGFDTYFRTSLTSVADVAVGATKALAYGAAVPLVASVAGLAARGGAPGVGRATTVAVIGASVAILLLDLVIGVLAYALEGR